MSAETRDATAGVWIWRLEHPDWSPHVEWPPRVTSTCVECGGEVVVFRPDRAAGRR
jgi:hypothetical protein